MESTNNKSQNIQRESNQKKKIKRKPNHKKPEQKTDSKYCTMCSIFCEKHYGTIKCPTCECLACHLHEEDLKQYGGCPSCWCNSGNKRCSVCNVSK